MNRNDYDDRRRRPLTGFGADYYRNPKEDHHQNRFGNRSLRMQTLSLEEAVDRYRSRSPYNNAPYHHESRGGGGGASRQPPRHSDTRTAAGAGGAPFRYLADRYRDDRRGTTAASAATASTEFTVPQEMEATFEPYERPMDPRAFREECRKAYMEAAAARQRNAEMSVWGRCNWATYDKFDPRKNRRH